MSLSEAANDEPGWESAKNGYWCSVWLCRLVGSFRIGGKGVVSLFCSCGRMSLLSTISGRSHASMSCLSGRSDAQQSVNSSLYFIENALILFAGILCPMFEDVSLHPLGVRSPFCL